MCHKILNQYDILFFFPWKYSNQFHSQNALFQFSKKKHLFGVCGKAVGDE